MERAHDEAPHVRTDKSEGRSSASVGGGSGSMTTFDTCTMPAPTARRSCVLAHVCVCFARA